MSYPYCYGRGMSHLSHSNLTSAPIANRVERSSLHDNAFIEKLFKQQREAYCLSHVEQSSLRGEFLFLGADVESVEYAKSLNVDSESIQQFECNGEGVQVAMSYSSGHISKRRRRQSPSN
jgi:hypothetical protein